jgi:hypothetical protein
MVRVGFVLNIIGILIVIAVSWLMLPWVFSG